MAISLRQTGRTTTSVTFSISGITANRQTYVWLSNIIIDSVSIDNGVGLPIGYQSSQLYALILLNDMDHLIKEKLHIKH